MADTNLAANAGSEEAQSLIAGAAPFSDLPAAVSNAIAEVSQIRTYAAGETIYALGQYDGSEIFIVAEGVMKATLADPESGAMMINAVNAGEIFGLAAAIAGDDNVEADKLTLTADSDAKIVAVEVEAFRVIVAQRPSLTRNLMHHFARSLSGSRFQGVSQESSPERSIYAALMEYVERDAVSAGWRIAKMPKHRELAEKVDADESLVASAVAQLIQDGVAQRDYPGLIISDIGQLNRLAS